MESKTNRMIKVTAVAAALGLCAMQMSAQQGDFTLPVAAHWGNVVLQPGSHRVSMPIEPSGLKIVYLESNNERAMTLPVTSQPADEGMHSYIRLSKINGTYYVTAYQNEIAGHKYFFAKPKSDRSAGPADVEMGESTLISVASK